MPFPRRVGCWKTVWETKLPGFFTHEYIPSRAWRDVKRAGADHIVKSIGVYACGIYDGPAFILRIGCLNPITVWYSGSIVPEEGSWIYFHFCLKAELYPVSKAFLPERWSFEGTDNAACGRIEHGVYIFGKIGFDFVDSFPSRCAGRERRSQCRADTALPDRSSDLLKNREPGSRFFEGKIQLFGKKIHHPVSLHIQPGLPGSGNGVESRVDDGAVGL